MRFYGAIFPVGSKKKAEALRSDLPAPRIPLELLLQVFSYIHGRRDLQNLALTCRFIKTVVEPDLWSIVESNDGIKTLGLYSSATRNRGHIRTNIKRLLALYRSLETSRIGSYIIILRMSISRASFCRYCGTKYGADLRAHYIQLTDTCCCSSLDRQFGSIVTNLPNLRTLSFHCQLNHTTGTDMHGWLANLKTPDLRELEILCSAPSWTLEGCKRFLAPCMRKLTNIKLDIRFHHRYFHLPPSTLQSLFPALDTFSISSLNTSSPESWILANRPIKRLCVNQVDNRDYTLTDVLTKNSCQLELLYVPKINFWLPSQDPSPYLNLAFIGTVNITVTASSQQSLTILRPLSFLKNLRMLNMKLIGPLVSMFWDDSFFMEMELRHPELLTVYLATRGGDFADYESAIVYNRVGYGEWKPRNVRLTSRASHYIPGNKGGLFCRLRTSNCLRSCWYGEWQLRLRRPFHQQLETKSDACRGDRNPTKLPTELVLEILSYLQEDKVSLSRMCQISLYFRKMVEEILYTDLRLDTPDAQTHGWSMTYPQSMALYRTLEVPRISELVTSLRIDLAKWLLCPKSIIRRRVERDKGSKKYPCRCASLDAALGKALVALPNLVILHLRCWLCWQDGPPMFRSVRHLYLRNLCTRNLQHFSLQCGCLCKTRTRWDNLLASPCLADIRSLDLQWSYYFPPESPEEFLISHKGVLPRLEAMTYIDDSFSRALLRSRPIKRLANFQYGSRASATRDLHENLEKSPGELTHLFVEDLRQWLEKSIVVNLEPYRNLQSVGCVAVLLDRAKTQEENVLNSMKPLIPLQRLEEIELMYHWEPEPVAAVLCERMCQKHPRLRRIFFSVDLFSHSPDYAPKTMTWERDKAGLWKGTRGPLLNWWDYICQ